MNYIIIDITSDEESLVNELWKSIIEIPHEIPDNVNDTFFNNLN